MKKAMLITVGTGKSGDVASGIAFAVRQAHPDFVLFIGTVLSLQETLPLALEKEKLEEGRYETRTTANENDVDKSAVEYIEYVREVIRKGYGPEVMVVDFTSGTKAMSAAMVLAAMSEEVGAISYVTGERGDGGRVITGTERLMIMEPNLMLAEGKMRKAAELFNVYQYAGCLVILEDLKGRILKPDVVERMDLLAGLARAYQAWDRFDHRIAMTQLDGLTGHRLLPAWGLKKKVETHKAFLHRLPDAGDYSLERAVDLWNNASRRGEEGKYDDAVARIYRLLEYMAQAKLHRDHDGLVAGDLNIAKLPTALRETYSRKRKESSKISLGLVDSYELLSDLGNGLGQAFMTDFRKRGGEVKDVLGLRNNSILAHGFGPVEEKVYSRAAGLADRYLDVAFQDWRDRAREASFLMLGET